MPQLSQLSRSLSVAVPVAGDRARLHLLRDRARNGAEDPGDGRCARAAHRRRPRSGADRRGRPRTRPRLRGASAWTPRAPKRRGSPQEAKAESGRDTEAKVKAAADKINRQGRVRRRARSASALDSARAEIEAVAAEATQEMVRALTGLTVDEQGRRCSGEGGAQCLAPC